MEWSPLKKILFEIYKQENIESNFAEDEPYLHSALDFTEELWGKQIPKIDQVNVLLFSEAPLFGKDKSYIYNPDYGFTAFFYFNDLRAVYGDSLRSSFKTKREKKEFFIKKLNDAGILVFDMFPYAFNPRITSAIHYQSMPNRLYSDIFSKTMEYYFCLKLSSIETKIDHKTVFAVRYKKLLMKTGSLIKTALKKHGIQSKEIVSLNGVNMSMDRSYLSMIYPKSTH